VTRCDLACLKCDVTWDAYWYCMFWPADELCSACAFRLQKDTSSKERTRHGEGGSRSSLFFKKYTRVLVERESTGLV
jgi:hypothetical protein